MTVSLKEKCKKPELSILAPALGRREGEKVPAIRVVSSSYTYSFSPSFLPSFMFTEYGNTMMNGFSYQTIYNLVQIKEHKHW